jgi:hypothetical protein
MSTFESRAELFEALCHKWKVPVPPVKRSLPTDPCDFTDENEVRLNIEAAGDTHPNWHVAHVFGHYICCLHAYGDEKQGGAVLCDQVADAIASMILGE